MIQPLSDNDLLSATRSGDDLAFRTLVERYESAVAGVVIGMLGPGADADDVGQETFIRFHRALDQFRGDATLGTYLRRIAMNLSLNALKRRKRFHWRLLSRDAPDSAPIEPAVEAYDPERTERRDMVRWAVGALSETHRPVVVLRLLEERSTSETAEILQIPPGTVMSRLSRGIAELKRLLAPYMKEGFDAS
ncbi:MAG: RNA polymerase sigma factor [Gemmatimonadaceae bacterium]|nr:RNA polymerase sigma factor [Gemmatimonadaceae bacterium]